MNTENPDATPTLETEPAREALSKREQILQHKRDYNTKYRARLKAAGVTRLSHIKAKQAGQHVCDWPKCGMSFPSVVGLRMHRVRAHISPWTTTQNFHHGKPKRNQRMVTCPKCLKGFKGMQALRMHTIRVHTKAGKEGALHGAHMGGIARMKTGQPNWKTRSYRRKAYREQVARYHAQGLNAHGQPFKDNAISRGLRKAASQGTLIGPRPDPDQYPPHTKRGQRKTPYVFPVPQDEQGNMTLTPAEPSPAPVRLMRHCPDCGCDLGRWQYV